MAKGHKSRTMTPYKPKKGPKRNKRNGAQKQAAMKDAITKMTKRGFGR